MIKLVADITFCQPSGKLVTGILQGIAREQKTLNLAELLSIFVPFTLSF